MNTYEITRYGHTFTLRADDELMEAHYRKGELSEPHLLDWMHRNLPRGGVWIDAGANIGNHTLPFALWADQVIAFEPMDVNVDLLMQNMAAFKVEGRGRIMVLSCGVGREEGYASAKLGGTGKNCQWELTPGDECEASIPIAKIDNHVRDTDDVRVIKLDVEGMEQDALAGAMGTIARCLPELFIEIWDEAILADITATLAPLGYVLTERYNVSPTFHFSASGRYPVTYKPAARLRP